MASERARVTALARMTGSGVDEDSVEQPEKTAEGEDEEHGEGDFAGAAQTPDADELGNEGDGGADSGDEADGVDDGVAAVDHMALPVEEEVDGDGEAEDDDDGAQDAVADAAGVARAGIATDSAGDHHEPGRSATRRRRR